jgi:cytochrome c oxidase accessory protein FixG
VKKRISTAQISSLDEFGHRIGLNPAEVSGFYRRYRTIVQTVLVLFFLVLPWTQINQHQALYLNIVDREFYFFGLLLKAHNAPLLLFILLGGALSLAFVTSVWGRIWCGWTCPQTVFIDGLYRRIEYFIEGNYLKRRKMKTDDLSLSLVTKKTVKWVLFYVASAIIAHSFLAYFVGAHQFIKIIELGPNSNLTLFYFAQILSLFLLFNFGWFREQFCTIMCPYGRIQALLIDQNSLAVVYDEKRNDCVNCNRCVNVCPIGIDIRNGLQMECIACTACIDACDEIMVKVNKPTGLIKYDTLNSKKISLLKPRSVLYLIGITICVLGLIISLVRLKHSEAFILRSLSTTFSLQKENDIDQITNQFRVALNNQSNQAHKYKINILNQPSVKIISQSEEVVLKPKEHIDWHIFLMLPVSEYNKIRNQKIKIEVYDSEVKSDFSKVFEVSLLGPSQ